MNKRLEQFMKSEQLTSAKLAEILSVQPSSISHLLSGRNKPNFDFISKLLKMFPELNSRWIINGQGDMYLKQNNSNPAIVEPQIDTIQPVNDDLFSLPEITTQLSENKQTNAVNDVMTSDFVTKNPEPILNTSLNEPIESSTIDINTEKVSQSKSTICHTNIRTVDKVLLLYNDNTFEFFDKL